MIIQDEYGETYAWEDYKKEVVDHGSSKPEPVKWVYKESKLFGNNGKKYLFTEDCDPEEADLFAPFDHSEYGRTEKMAQEKYKAWDYYIGSKPDYSADPDYPVDWVSGDFS